MPIDFEAMICFLKDLVRTESTPGQEQRAIERVAAEMNRLGYDNIAIDDYGNLSGIVNGAHAGPTLLLDAHVDTVGVAPGVPWQYEPFGAVIQDGKMYGRGTGHITLRMRNQEHHAAADRLVQRRHSLLRHGVSFAGRQQGQ